MGFKPEESMSVYVVGVALPAECGRTPALRGKLTVDSLPTV